MAAWIHRIRLNDVLQDLADKHDLTRFEEKCPKEVKDAISAELLKAAPLRSFAPRIRKCRSIAAVNRLLHAVFDEADRCRVWCGGFGA